MSVDSDAFEALIERIIQLSRDGSTEVRRDDHISDPDDPKSKRQVDVSFLKNGKNVFVECRKHSVPQDVKWVEELIGRQASLKPDQMIGVSSSGYTKLAKIKAETHGIVLREVNEIKDAEILSWGTSVVADVSYVRFRNLSLTLESSEVFQSEFYTKVQQELLDGGHYGRWLADLSLNIKDKLQSGSLVPFEVELSKHPSFLIHQFLAGVSRFQLTGLVNLETKKYHLTAARTSKSIQAQEGHLVHVFEYGESGSELHLSDETFAWAIDFSKVHSEKDCFFSGDISLDLGQPRSMDRAYIYGLNKWECAITLPRLLVRIA